MKETIIKPVTRIAGHAKVTLKLDENEDIKDARLSILEFYGFEKVCEGKPFWEMPMITSRVCGVCSMSHQHASAKTGDAIMGVDIPPAARALRELAQAGEVLQSHALHYFYLSAPDFLLGDQLLKGGIFSIIANKPDVAAKGIKIRKFARDLLFRLTGEGTHSVFMVPGGVNNTLSSKDRDALLSGIDEVIADIQFALDLTKDLHLKSKAEFELGSFPSGYMGLVNERGELEFCNGKLRLRSNTGKTLEEFEPKDYLSFVEEYTEDWSYVKFPYYKKLGRPGGIYRVGPLGRLNVVDKINSLLAGEELKEFKELGRNGIVEESFYYHYARVIEMLHIAERIKSLLSDDLICDTRIRTTSKDFQPEGVGVVEAPRGTLFHHYKVDETGKIKKVNLIIPTTQNNPAMNRAIMEVAKSHVKGQKLSEEFLNRIEAAIRCYDPCLSCAAHALGQMPLVVELVSHRGEVLDGIKRG